MFMLKLKAHADTLHAEFDAFVISPNVLQSMIVGESLHTAEDETVIEDDDLKPLAANATYFKDLKTRHEQMEVLMDSFEDVD